MIGSLAAFDHWRQRVTLIESVPVLGLDDAAVDAAYDAAVASIERAVAEPGPAAAVRARRAAVRRTTCCPT